MKTKIWDILSILLILGMVMIAGITLMILVNPTSSLNPYPLPTMPPTLIIPTATETPLRLPATWTPTGGPIDEVSPTRRATATIIPTNTLFVLPSMTPLPVIPTNTRMPLVGLCKVVGQIPSDGTQLQPGTAFTTRWTVKNTGGESWQAENTDIRYIAGDAMHTGKNAVDLTQSVPIDATLEIVVEMVAPDKPGYHITYWGLQAGGTKLCSFYVEILIKK